MTEETGKNAMFTEGVPPEPKQDETSQEQQTQSEHYGYASGNIIDLPSKGKLGYPSQVEYRDILVSDEETIKMATEDKYIRTMNNVIKRICNNPPFFDDLTIHDRDYIMVFVWGNNYNPVKKLEITCRHCENKDVANVNILKQDIQNISENFVSTFSYPIKSANGKKASTRLTTVRDENMAEKFMAETDGKYLFDTVIFSLITDVPSEKHLSLEEKIHWIQENMSSREAAMLKQYNTYFNYGVDMTYNHTCSKCEGVTTGEIPFRFEDFIAVDVSDDFEKFLFSDQVSEDSGSGCGEDASGEV